MYVYVFILDIPLNFLDCFEVHEYSNQLSIICTSPYHGITVLEKYRDCFTLIVCDSSAYSIGSTVCLRNRFMMAVKLLS